MPFYDYRCRACDATFDRMRPMAEADHPTACACGSEETFRLVSRIAKPAKASTGPSLGGAGLPMASGNGGGGGCCGGGCCG